MMRLSIAAALALTAAPSLPAQTASAIADLSTATPIGGHWSWAQTADGSEATFTDAYSRAQPTLHCTRATRRVSIAKAASAAAPFLSVWTSSQTRNLPAGFNPATGKLSAELAAFDPLLDAIAASRGRIGVSVSGSAPLVVPPWAEIARAVEDCRV
jgi:hypothetical protein